MRAAVRQQHHHDLFERREIWLEMQWDGMMVAVVVVVVIPG
jgi:hypothetical protein